MTMTWLKKSWPVLEMALHKQAHGGKEGARMSRQTRVVDSKGKRLVPKPAFLYPRLDRARAVVDHGVLACVDLVS